MNQAGWDTFLKLCLTAKNDKQLSSLFELFLTHEERDSLATRCLIIQGLLKQDKSQRDLAEALQVSIAKITRGSNELKRTPSKLIEFLKVNL